MGNVFGEKKSPKEIVREQKRLVNRSVRQLEREITGLKREEAKIIKNIKKDAKANQMSSVKIMAKDLVRIRKQQTKFLNLTAQLRAISLQMTTVQSINTMSESIKKVSKVIVTHSCSRCNSDL
uniref:Charged multivesicular body protein 2a n=1 Tax=Lotharella globosa TaxID=91324 RepID=A0A7S3ZEY6_9EUKA